MDDALELDAVDLSHADLLASDTAAYFATVIECASIGGPCDLASPTLYTMATNLAQLAAEAIRDGIEGDWTVVYDTWLQRATQHALQAGVMGRDG